MAENINTVALTGNLTRDPELRTLPSGTSVCGLRIAVNGSMKQGDKWVERVNYFDVTVWGKQAEVAAEYLKQGRPIALTGRLEYREWESDAGKRSAVQVVADRVQFLNPASGRPSDDDDEPDDEPIPF